MTCAARKPVRSTLHLSRTSGSLVHVHLIRERSPRSWTASTVTDIRRGGAVSHPRSAPEGRVESTQSCTKCWAVPTPCVNQRPPRPVQTGRGRSVTPSSTQLASLGRLLTTGADQTPGPRPVTLSSEGRPLLAVNGGVCSLDGVWSLAIAGVQRTGAVCRASVLLSWVLVEAGVTPAVHLHGPAPLATPHHNP